MTLYWENYKGRKMDEICPLCKVPGFFDTQKHSFECKVIGIIIKIDGKFTDIFNKIDGQLAKTVENIELFRENYFK